MGRLTLLGAILLAMAAPLHAQTRNECALNGRFGLAIPLVNRLDPGGDRGVSIDTRPAGAVGFTCGGLRDFVFGGDIEVDRFGPIAGAYFLASAGWRTGSAIDEARQWYEFRASAGLARTKSVGAFVLILPTSGELVELDGVSPVLGIGLRAGRLVSRTSSVFISVDLRATFLDEIGFPEQTRSGTFVLLTVPAMVGFELRL